MACRRLPRSRHDTWQVTWPGFLNIDLRIKVGLQLVLWTSLVVAVAQYQAMAPVPSTDSTAQIHLMALGGDCMQFTFLGKPLALSGVLELQLGSLSEETQSIMEELTVLSCIKGSRLHPSEGPMLQFVTQYN